MVDGQEEIRVTSRERILANVRNALGRAEDQPLDPAAPLSAPLLRIPLSDGNLSLNLFVQNFEKLSGKALVVPDRAAVAPALAKLLDGKHVVLSGAAYLKDCGINAIPQVPCAEADIGITSANYALAETGSLVLFSSASEPRLISLLPPIHVAVFPRSCILRNLDELLSVLPNPAGQTSSMVLITGPSRTADIEQILVRGVHGPGQIYAVIVDESAR
jgi:L-lactate dehydrogenase complex protein LldG